MFASIAIFFVALSFYYIVVSFQDTQTTEIQPAAVQEASVQKENNTQQQKPEKENVGKEKAQKEKAEKEKAEKEKARDLTKILLNVEYYEDHIIESSRELAVELLLEDSMDVSFPQSILKELSESTVESYSSLSDSLYERTHLFVSEKDSYTPEETKNRLEYINRISSFPSSFASSLVLMHQQSINSSEETIERLEEIEVVVLWPL